MVIREINLWRVKAALAFVAEDCRFGMRRPDDWRKDAKLVGDGLLPVTVATDNAPYRKIDCPLSQAEVN